MDSFNILKNYQHKLIIERGFIIVFIYMYIMYINQMHPIYLTLSYPLLPPSLSFSGFHYAIFRQIYNVGSFNI
jgi:ABC-type Na+ efflux pump permease subunit